MEFWGLITMDYDGRKRIIANWLLDFLKRYEAPSHLDKDASREEMLLMVEDINSECPAANEGGLKWLLDEAAKYVRKNQVSRRWPTINMFVKGIKENRDKIKKDLLETSEEFSPQLNIFKINAQRIKKKEPVDEKYVSGKYAELLIEKNLISETDLEPYRNS